MKRLTYIALALVVSLLSFVSCDREQFPNNGEDGSTGTLSLASLKIEVDADNETPTRATAAKLDNFMVKVIAKTASSTKEVRSWKYSEMPELFTLPVGTYEVVVTSAAEENVATFEGGFWKGTQNFIIKENTVTEIATVLCKFSSIKVTVEYDTELKTLLGDDILVTVSVEKGGSLQYPQNEERAGYFKAMDELNVLKAHFVGTVEGVKQDFTTGFPNVKPGEFRAVKFSLKSVNDGNVGTSGTANIRLNIDATCEVIEEGALVNPGTEDSVEDFPSEGENPDPSEPTEDAPSIVGKSLKGQPFDIRGTYEIEGACELIVEMFAPQGMANVNVTIDSSTLTNDVLTSVGLANSFDLAHPGNLAAGLQGLGFPTGDQVIGQKQLVFDITQFTQLLGLYGAATHKFIIEVVDQKGNKVKETLTLISL